MTCWTSSSECLRVLKVSLPYSPAVLILSSPWCLYFCYCYYHFPSYSFSKSLSFIFLQIHLHICHWFFSGILLLPLGSFLRNYSPPSQERYPLLCQTPFGARKPTSSDQCQGLYQEKYEEQVFQHVHSPLLEECVHSCLIQRASHRGLLSVTEKTQYLSTRSKHFTERSGYSWHLAQRSLFSPTPLPYLA